ncbi:HK97 family phage prohead protease [Mesorhizobium sp. AaZ16]|uniref:HK97 family phage prohead protease n=1 Tax=Mesorhizobium sp. AaZ16 TaxID=3402289 RepID=UPI00374E46B7
MWFTESGRAPLPGSRTVAGYCLEWGVPSPVRDGFDECFTPHSVEWPSDLRLCRNHEKTRPLTRLGHGFRLASDSRGLWAEADADAIYDGDGVLHGARFGALRGWSVSFVACRERWDRSGDRPLRIIEGARLLELSIVDRGAHRTSIGVLSRMQRAA